jgi:hypothetical protein
MVKRKNILDLKLIEAVARRPQLYDKTHTEYSHQNKKTRIWRDIAAEVGFEGKNFSS